MSRPNVGWLRVGVFPERVRRREGRDVTAVLPDPPKNGQYPAWVYVLCSFFVILDYLVVAVVTLVLAFLVVAGAGVSLPDGQVGGWVALVGIAGVVYAFDGAVTRVRTSPIDDVVRSALRPARDWIHRRLVTVEMVSTKGSVSTARPTPVVEFTGSSATSDDTESTPTTWGSTQSIPPEGGDTNPLPFAEGDRFQSFSLGPKVGQGALSVVWRAEDTDSGETVALKLFNPAVDEDTRRTFQADFLHEAKVLRFLRDHEHVITLRDWGHDPYPWIAVEYVEAGTVREHLPVSLQDALGVLLAVTGAIEFAHGQDVSHTDLKPENVLFSEDYFGRLVRVTDWGKRPIVNPDLEPMLTRPYAAPEQFDELPTNEPEAELIDIYQLGMLGYELFTGTQPFLAGGDTDTEHRVRNEVPPPPSDYVTELPEAVDDVILQAIAKDPADRYQTVAQFRSELIDVVLPDVVPGE